MYDHSNYIQFDGAGNPAVKLATYNSDEDTLRKGSAATEADGDIAHASYWADVARVNQPNRVTWIFVSSSVSSDANGVDSGVLKIVGASAGVGTNPTVTLFQAS